MQGKFDPIQRQGELEEEELLQGQFIGECIQCQAPEEEEELISACLTLFQCALLTTSCHADLYLVARYIRV